MNKKTILAIFIILLLVSAFLFWGRFGKNQSPPGGKSVKVTIKQTPTGRLVFESAAFSNSPPLDYKLNLPKNYYLVKIFNREGKELFSGKIPSQKILMPPPPLPGQNPGEPIIQPLTEIVLFLPYYKNAEKIMIFNEKGTLLLEINLAEVLKS